MPVYNEAPFLRSSIQSILDQSYRDFEFLILNDDSTDNSEEIILSFKDPRINYLKTDKIKISELLNLGIKRSSGDIIARMDADDIALPYRLERQMNFINNILETEKRFRMADFLMAELRSVCLFGKIIFDKD